MVIQLKDEIIASSSFLSDVLAEIRILHPHFNVPID